MLERMYLRKSAVGGRWLKFRLTLQRCDVDGILAEWEPNGVAL
jgi:hypothetical protein